MESQIPFEKEASTSTQHHDDVFIKDVITSETNHVASSQPVKKATRQWAAWTRQEEESFFTALRQVGKNFEKITSRVQSKNKDQVRHYYYRLVRRMNKLLGPELSLDAKNSKDTNAAMLRWWSLLEKHSCKASKLHLKPRRFKMFLETLEHQLLKDRKKNIRKRSTATQGGNGSHPVKPPRQRRRSGTAPTTTTTTTTDAYKKWEKAAIAGVSLVADAAEHLERTALDKLADTVQDLQGGDKGSDPIPKTKSIIPPVPIFHQNILSSMKLKLQLFPVDETTRRALEMDNHNPHLELTLSTRKKISSVLNHIPPPKDLTSLTDMYWPESLGALDLDVASCRYHDTGDVILSDSLGLGGLNCSLDAFQSCSFFGLEKKDTTTLTTLGPPASSSQGEV